jgi:hypothetical protein
MRYRPLNAEHSTINGIRMVPDMSANNFLVPGQPLSDFVNGIQQQNTYTQYLGSHPDVPTFNIDGEVVNSTLWNLGMVIPWQNMHPIVKGIQAGLVIVETDGPDFSSTIIKTSNPQFTSDYADGSPYYDDFSGLSGVGVSRVGDDVVFQGLHTHPYTQFYVTWYVMDKEAALDWSWGPGMAKPSYLNNVPLVGYRGMLHLSNANFPITAGKKDMAAVIPISDALIPVTRGPGDIITLTTGMLSSSKSGVSWAGLQDPFPVFEFDITHEEFTGLGGTYGLL